jgi:hypothetical protein
MAAMARRPRGGLLQTAVAACGGSRLPHQPPSVRMGLWQQFARALQNRIGSSGDRPLISFLSRRRSRCSALVSAVSTRPERMRSKCARGDRFGVAERSVFLADQRAPRAGPPS